MFVFRVCRLASRRCHNISTVYPVPVSPLLDQLDSPDFAWRTKNSLWDELNVLKRKLNVKITNTIDDYRFKSSMLS